MPGAARISGLFGKLPARGDFIRVGLPRRFTDPFDAWLGAWLRTWLRAALPESRARLGEGRAAAWLEAPIWRFALPSGACGPDPAFGLMMPSLDRVGRHFPLVLACLGTAADPDAPRFMAAAELAGLDAVRAGTSPEQVAARLAHTPDAIPPFPVLPAGALWWTHGGPRHPSACLALSGLPDPGRFAAMLEPSAC
jgi:type VI secretion system protein ImpM